MNKNLVKIFDLFQAADLWRRTSQRPALVFNSNDRVIFTWPDSPEIQHAIEANSKDKKIQIFTQLYKSLRSELNLLKSQVDGGSGDE